MDGDNTPQETPGLKPAWQPGQSGNPKGRPKGARSKLSEAFLNALADDFAEHGIATIVQVRVDRPCDYIKVIASLMPKELTGEDGEAIQIAGVIFKGLNG